MWSAVGVPVSFAARRWMRVTPSLKEVVSTEGPNQSSQGPKVSITKDMPPLAAPQDDLQCGPRPDIRLQKRRFPRTFHVKHRRGYK